MWSTRSDHALERLKILKCPRYDGFTLYNISGSHSNSFFFFFFFFFFFSQREYRSVPGKHPCNWYLNITWWFQPSWALNQNTILYGSSSIDPWNQIWYMYGHLPRSGCLPGTLPVAQVIYNLYKIYNSYRSYSKCVIS